VPSRHQFARELLNERMFLGNSSPNEREENILQCVIHCINEDMRSADEGVCAPRARGVV
jgi:polynucleotide 5'-kinase involved in rRNA processing